MNCATSCINVAVGGNDCFTNRQLVSTQSEKCIPIYQFFYIISLFAAELEDPKIGM